MRPLASEFPSDVERGRVEVHLEEMDSSSIPLGSTTIDDFCTWISDRADVAVKDSLITDISWWEEQAGLKHQLVLLRFEHKEASGDIHVYYLKLERAGRTTCNERAIDKATISERAETSNPLFLDRHMLFFALVRDEDSELLPTEIEATSAFEDFLDQKWRGPPATLKNLARYLRVIVAREPNYTLWSSNCFWFSRHVMHIIGLRHYSFPFIAFTMDTDKFALPRTADNMNYGTTQIEEYEWKAHDPSSIGLLFRFLHYEEWRNGILMFRRLIIILCVLLSFGITAGSGYGFYYLFVPASHAQKPAAGAALAAFVAVCGILPICYIWARPTIRGSVGLLTRRRIRGAMAHLVRDIEREDAPDCVRGDFIPPKIPLYKQRVGHMRMSGNNLPTYTMQVVAEARKLPDRWARDAQIYAPARQEYKTAFKEMQSLKTTVSEDVLRKCTPQAILEKKWCGELVKMIHVTDDLGVTLRLMELLLCVCENEEGAKEAVKAGAIGWMRLWSGYESRFYTNIRLVACRTIEVIARHKCAIRALLAQNMCNELVAVIRTSNDVHLREPASMALAHIVQFPLGAQAAVDAEIRNDIILLLQSESTDCKTASCLIIECVVWLEPADEDAIKLLLWLLKTGDSDLKHYALMAMHSIACLEDGAKMLLAAGALDFDWTVLLKSSDDSLRSGGALVLIQLVRHDHTATWKQTTKYCAPLVALIRDGNEYVSSIAMRVISCMYSHPEWIEVARDAGAMQVVCELVKSPDASVQLNARRLRDLLAAEAVQTDGHAHTCELLECEPEVIVRLNRCRELVEMIRKTADLELKLAHLKMLSFVCGTLDGAEAAIAGGTLLLMKEYLTSNSIKIRVWACDILAEIAKHVDTVLSINVLPQFVAFINDSSVHLGLVEHAIDALDQVSASGAGAEAAIDAEALFYIGLRLEPPNTDKARASAWRILERLAFFQPAPRYVCKPIVELWRSNEIPAALLSPLFGAAYNVASFKFGADALVDAGALEALSQLLQPGNIARRAAPLVLSQILVKRSEEPDPSRSAERFCPQFLSLIRDINDGVVDTALLAISKLTAFPKWKKALQDAGATNIFAELGLAESPNTEIRQHVEDILETLSGLEEDADADTQTTGSGLLPPSQASSSRQLVV